MKIINWNIRAGGGKNINEVVKFMLPFNADMVVLSEYKHNQNGTRIRQELSSNGYKYIESSSEQMNKNSVLIASKREFEIKKLNEALDIFENCLLVKTPVCHVFAVFCADKSLTRNLFNFIYSKSPEWIDKGFILIGDFNTGPRGKELNRNTHISKLEDIGWINGWKKFNGDTVYWNFQSKTGKSQPDHVFVSRLLDKKLQNVKFHSEPLESGISDHALMEIDFDI